MRIIPIFFCLRKETGVKQRNADAERGALQNMLRLFRLLLFPFCLALVAPLGAVLLNNRRRANILLPAYLLCYAEAKQHH